MRRLKRALSSILAVVLVLSLCPFFRDSGSALAADGDNLTGWRLGNTTTMNGNPEDGWRIDFTGMQYEGNGTSYTANVGVQKLQVKFNLSELRAGKTIILQLGDRKNDFGKCDSTVINFVFERKMDDSLYFYVLGLKNGGNAHTIYDFDFSKEHILEFVLEEGRWLPALDGTVRSGDEAANAFCDSFVKNMSERHIEKTVISFAPVSGDDTLLTIRNINFEEKSMDVTGWSQGETSAMSGSSENGWKLDFYGGQFLEYGTSCETGIDTAKLQVHFSLSRLKNDKAFILQLGNEKGSFGDGMDDTGTRINFVFEKKADGNLLFYGMDSVRFPDTGGIFCYTSIQNFDSAANHVLEFTKEMGKWLPTLDGQVLSGTEVENTVFDSFVREMSDSLAGTTTVSFAPADIPDSKDILTITGIRFTRKSLEPGDAEWVAPLVTGDGKNGYEVENKRYKWSYFTKRLDPEKVTVQAKLSMANNEIVAMELSDRTEMGLLPSEEELKEGKCMMFMLGRQGINGEDLRVSLWDGTNEKALGIYWNFDFDAVHSFALRQMNGVWCLMVDGEVYGMDSADLRKYAEYVTSTFDGKVYYRFFGLADYQLSQVRFLVNGDLDGNYERTEADVDILRKHLTGASSESIGLENVNEDKQTDVADLVHLMKLTEAPIVHAAGAVAEGEAVVVRLSDFGVAGDGRTNALEALTNALTMVRHLSTKSKVVLEFEADTSYYFKAVNGETKIIDLMYCKDITLRGNNTTIVMDKGFTPGTYFGEDGEDTSGEHRLTSYVNVDFSKNITLEGLNFKFSQPWYTLSKVDKVHLGTQEAGSGTNNYVNKTDPPYIEITTEHSLGITETYTPDNRTEFGLPYTGGKNRSHMYIDRIQVLDANARKYRVYFQDWDEIREKMTYLQSENLQFILGIPYWDRGEKSDGSGSIIVTNTTNFEMTNVNVWAATSFVFHMRNNCGEFHIRNCNVTPEWGLEEKERAWASQVDIFHLKENRCKFVIEDCLLEKAGDDVFNLSTTYLHVNEVYSDNEFNMYCNEFDGVYYMKLQEGDTITLVNELTGAFVGCTRIKKVVEQNGAVNRVIVEDSLGLTGSNLTDLAVYVDSLGQPNSIIRNCTIEGTYRFRTPITIEDSTLYTLYAWIDNIPQLEGPIPMDITFQNCIFSPLKVADRDRCYMSPDYMMQLGTTCNIGSEGIPSYFAENILFDNCRMYDNGWADLDDKRIDFMKRTAEVSFVRDGREYLKVEPWK